AALNNALLFLFTEDGIPCVYYGTEQGFAGGNDPANREDLWWSGYDQQNADYQWVRRLANIRRSYKALTHGDVKVTWASDRTGSESDAGIFAFERTGGDAGDAYALIVLNTNGQKESSTQFNAAGMKVGAAGGTGLVNVLDSNETVSVAGDGTLIVNVPASSGKLFVRSGDLISGL
ncbi:MAG: alpha-amylase, partial [Polyangiaceae bacterium]|nr:alpha-amylase [Polyangiaceae bacterium]